MKNLFTTQLLLGKDKGTVEVGAIYGKVSKNGVSCGETEKGTAYARFTLSVGSTDYDVKHTEYVLHMKDAHLTRNGEKSDKYPLLFVSVVAYGKLAELISKNVEAGDNVRVIGTLGTNEYKSNTSLTVTVSDYEKEFASKSEPASAPVDDIDGPDGW